MQKYILFLGGGRWQLPWFQFLKAKGHKLLLVDPYENSPCVNHADIFFKSDVKDTDKILNFINANNLQIEIVTSDQTDVSTIPVAILSEKLGITVNSIDSIERFTNKAISREFLKRNFNKHFPEFEIVRDADTLENFIKRVGTSIIKPVDAQSSRGIFKLDLTSSKEEIQNSFNESLSFGTKEFILVEEFITGNEITLEGLCIGNNHITLTGSNKKHFRTGIASDLCYPLTISNTLKNELISFHDTLIKSTGLNIGITHAEYIINEEKGSFYLVEVAARGGGSLIPSHIVKAVTGVDVYHHFYQALFNNDFKQLPKPFDNKGCTLHFFEFKSGKIKSIEGIEKCAQLDFVIEIGLEFKVGDTIKNASDDRSRQGFVIVTGTDKKQVQNNIQTIYSILDIKYE